MTETYTLTFPIEHQGKKITQVTIGRLKAKDMIYQERELAIIRKSKGMPVTDDDPLTDGETMLYTVSKAINLPLEVVEEMDIADMTSLTKKVTDFFGGKRNFEGSS